MKKVIAYCFVAAFLSSTAFANSEWIEKQAKYSQDMILKNTSRPDTAPGFVIAAPSRVSPNYYYHWVRDAALVMKSLELHLPEAQSESILKDYVQLVLHHQSVPTLAGLGEVKFNPNGTSFMGPWGRPQNDGPALRVIALTDLAFRLLDKGEVDYVKTYLYQSALPAYTAIKRDLEYVGHHWIETDFDLWEEVRGHHFYTRMAQRKALLLGATLAERLDDSGAAIFYRFQADQIAEQLERHWNSGKNYIETTLDRSTFEGLDYKYSNLDASVILSALHTNDTGLSFGVQDPRVQATFYALHQTYKEIYSINKGSDEVGIGRYPEDTYYNGNPWFLLTNGFAEYLFELVTHYRYTGQIEVTSINQDFMKKFAKIDQGITIIQKNDANFESAINKLLDQAHAYINKTKRHAGPDGQLDEQFDRNTGFMKSARDLTWSYSSFITMYEAYKASQ